MIGRRNAIVGLLGIGWLYGCTSVTCGEGTIEIDGMCVSKSAPPECGPGTHFDQTSGRCTSDTFASGAGVCGDGTNLVVSDAGVPTCIGLGGGGGCEAPLACPPPTEPNTVSLCGRIYDLEDTAPLDDGNPDNGEPWKTVEIRLYDPFAFIQNPGGATPLMKASPDSCGRYAIKNAPLPAAGIVALATDDVTGGADNLVLTGIADQLTAGAVRDRQHAFVLRRTTDQAWSTAAGLAAGQTFGKMGVYVPIFLDVPAGKVAPFDGTPAENVQVAAIEGAQRVVHPEKDYYFDDGSALSRKTLSATRSSTGKNGTALYVNQPSITTMSGVGNTPAGSCWRKDPAAAPVGAVFVQERIADASGCAQ